MYLVEDDRKTRPYEVKLCQLVLEPCKECHDVTAVETLDKEVDIIKRTAKASIRIFCTNRKCDYQLIKTVNFENVTL